MLDPAQALRLAAAIAYGVAPDGLFRHFGFTI